MDFIIAGTAASCAGFFTNPIEVCKTRMQLQGELRKKGQHPIHYRNIFHAVYVVGKNDGILALQKGLGPALGIQFIMNGFRLGTSQLAENCGYTRNRNGDLIISKVALSSGLGGSLGQYLANPLFLVKTHLQAQANEKIAVGTQHHHTGTLDALNKILEQQGIKGLFRGAGASLPRAFVASSAQITSFAYVKDYLKADGILSDSPYVSTFLAGMVAGVAISSAVTPFDFVLTRLHNQGVDVRGKGLLYDSYLDCVAKIYKTEGIMAFAKGFGPNYVRLGPHSVLCLIFWDLLKDVYDR